MENRLSLTSISGLFSIVTSFTWKKTNKQIELLPAVFKPSATSVFFFFKQKIELWSCDGIIKYKGHQDWKQFHIRNIYKNVASTERCATMDIKKEVRHNLRPRGLPGFLSFHCTISLITVCCTIYIIQDKLARDTFVLEGAAFVEYKLLKWQHLEP